MRAVTEEVNLEIRDLNDLTTKDEIVAATIAQMSTQWEAFRVKSFRPGNSGTQVAILGAGPDLAYGPMVVAVSPALGNNRPGDSAGSDCNEVWQSSRSRWNLEHRRQIGHGNVHGLFC